MSVLACARSGCESIMCSRLLLGAYICEDCWQELCEHKQSWPEVITRGYAEQAIVDFMNTRPGTFVSMDRDEAFAILTQK